MRQQLAQHSPDLIILDIMMPGDDGFYPLPADPPRPQVPIIMRTAASDEADQGDRSEPAPTTTSPSRSARASCRPSIKAAAPRRIPPAGERKEPSRRLRFAEWTLIP